MDRDPNTLTKTLIHPTHLLLRLQLLGIYQKWAQSLLKTHITISILWKIPMMTINSLICMYNTTENMLRKKNYLNTQMKT